MRPHLWSGSKPADRSPMLGKVDRGPRDVNVCSPQPTKESRAGKTVRQAGRFALLFVASSLVGFATMMVVQTICCSDCAHVPMRLPAAAWSQETTSLSSRTYQLFRNGVGGRGQWSLGKSKAVPLAGQKEQVFAKAVAQRCMLQSDGVSQPEKWQMDMLFSHMLYDDESRTAFCYIAKVGCSNWKRIFAVLKSGNRSHYRLPHLQLHLRSNGHVNYLSDLPYTEALARLETYRKVMFVRNPVTRLLGVYRDLVAWRPANASNAFMQRLWLQQRMPGLVGMAMKPDDVNITLTSFLNLVLSRDSVLGMDEHWQPYSANCLPCLVHYDYIGRHEDLSQSADDVLQALGLGQRVRFPRKELDYQAAPYRLHSAREQYRKVGVDQLQRVWQKYTQDMQLFGYEAPADFGSVSGSPAIERDTLKEFLGKRRH